MQYIYKLDINKLGEYKNKILTPTVILTDERRFHILEKHTNDYNQIIYNISSTISFPDLILEDSKNLNTLFFIKKISNVNLNVVVKLCIQQDYIHVKNSIMTSWLIRDKNLKRLTKKSKIIYIFE